MQNSSLGEKRNIGLLYRNQKSTTPLAKTKVEFLVTDGSVINIIKEINNPDDYYFSGDEITFTISITNKGIKIVRNLFFTDPIEPAIIPGQDDEFEVNTTHGTVIQNVSPIQIENITLQPGTTCTITISGIVA